MKPWASYGTVENSRNTVNVKGPFSVNEDPTSIQLQSSSQSQLFVNFSSTCVKLTANVSVVYCSLVFIYGLHSYNKTRQDKKHEQRRQNVLVTLKRICACG
ncbi:hypothetical protein INR49_016153 [Caranx melampygus]|nr:hypothetical protein INR49_016153 [Caranx melampygus]